MPVARTKSKPPGARRRKVILLVSYGAFLFVLVEIASRLFLAATFGVSLLWPGQMVDAYYPHPPLDTAQGELICHLKPIRDAHPADDDGYFDVLLLGASVIDKRWSDIDAVLQRRLEATLRRPVRTHNLGVKAHTSRDSFFKYRRLREVPFDLVVIYQAINDTRLNHYPDEKFRSDYGHLRWYAQVNLLEAHREIGLTALPYVVGRARATVAEWLGAAAYPPEQLEVSPPDDWLKYGGNIKTAVPFRENLARILDIARAKGEPVVLMTFAYYLAPGYSKDRFKNKQLDYDRHQTPIEVWGTPETVVAGIELHNGILRELAAQYDNALLVDQAAQMPTGKEYFQDICHLTYAGAEAFVGNLLEVVAPAINGQQ